MEILHTSKRLTFLEQLHHYLEDLAEPCNEMILRCSFEGHERKCSDLFYPQVGEKLYVPVEAQK